MIEKELNSDYLNAAEEVLLWHLDDNIEINESEKDDCFKLTIEKPSQDWELYYNEIKAWKKSLESLLTSDNEVFIPEHIVNTPLLNKLKNKHNFKTFSVFKK